MSSIILYDHHGRWFHDPNNHPGPTNIFPTVGGYITHNNLDQMIKIGCISWRPAAIAGNQLRHRIDPRVEKRLDSLLGGDDDRSSMNLPAQSAAEAIQGSSRRHV